MNASAADSLVSATIAELSDRLARREVSAREVADAFLSRIDAVEPVVEAFLERTADLAREAADAADRRLASGERSRLLGVPLGIKDNICTRGVLTTCASKILANFRPPYDATVVGKLNAAGAVALGKLNMDEFAMGSSCEHSAFHPTRNPWDPSRIPGGSSGGAAAAVAASECPGALGSDTGGSIRQPAALCGVTGLKPTYGRVSRYGLVAFASSLDQIGPLTRDARDAAILLSAIAGRDPRDSTSADVAVPDYEAALAASPERVRGLRIGLPRECFIDGLDPDVEKAVRDAAAAFESLGATISEISLPNVEHAVATYYLCATAEASSNLARYDGVQYGVRAPDTRDIVEMFTRTRSEGFGAEVKRRIMLGTYALSAGFYDAYYLKALKMRTLMRRDFDAAFARVDAILTPTAPTPAFKLGEKLSDPLQMYLSDVFTIPANLVGLPAIAAPCGFSGDGLPIGLQLTTPAFDETTALQAIHAYQGATDWHARRPPLG